MRKTALALAAAAALAGASCSSITTSVDYDPGTAFTTYKTYAYKDVFDRDAFEMKRVRAALDRTLAAKGLTKTDPKADTKPELWVVLHVKTHNDKIITTWGTGWGWGWGWGGSTWMRSHVEDAPVGTLFVDLVDTKAKELVWRGMASRAIDSSETPQDRAQVTQEAVDKLFDGFPPKVPPKA